MNIKSIEYFLIAAEEMNITRAAERLYISQQALSSHIKRLEDEYGVTLFERRPAFRLTKEGEEMVRYGRQILEAEARMQATFSDINVNCRAGITVGISRLRSRAFFPSMWKYYHTGHPNISIELVDGSSEKLNEMLLSGKLDLYLGINVSNDPQLSRIEVAKEEIQCCFSRKLLQHCYPDTWQEILQNALKNGLDLNQVPAMPFAAPRSKNRLRENLDRYFKNHPGPEFILECNQQEVIYELAKSGSTAGLVSPILFYTVQEELKKMEDSFYVLPLANDIADNTLSLVYRNDFPQPKYVMDFISVACMVLKKYANTLKS